MDQIQSIVKGLYDIWHDSFFIGAVTDLNSESPEYVKRVVQAADRASANTMVESAKAMKALKELFPDDPAFQEFVVVDHGDDCFEILKAEDAPKGPTSNG